MNGQVYSKSDLKNRVMLLKLQKENFEVHYGKFSSHIIFNGKKELFSDGIMKKEVFNANNMIKKDLLDNDISIILNHNRKDNLWYNNSSYIEDYYASYIYNIDINSAYLNSLNNTGFLQKKTFDFCSGISKGSRLKTIGLFASKKEVYTYIKGKLLDEKPKIIEGNLANVYYYSAYQVDKVMSNAALMLKGSFIFWWFDGIYFQSPCPFDGLGEHRFITELFEDYHFPHKIIELKDFTVRRYDEYIEVSYLKTGEPKPIIFTFIDKVIQDIINLQIKNVIIK